MSGYLTNIRMYIHRYLQGPIFERKKIAKMQFGGGGIENDEVLGENSLMAYVILS